MSVSSSGRNSSDIVRAGDTSSTTSVMCNLPLRSGWAPFFAHPKRIKMATHNDTNDRNRAADEAARTARTVTDEAARVGEQTARAGADMARRGTETARDSLQQSLNTATETVRRVTDQFTQVLGFNGPQSEELT